MMSLRAISTFSVPSKLGDKGGAVTTLLSNSKLGSSSSTLSFKPQRKLEKFAASVSSEAVALTGVVFQPFEEVKNDAFVVPVSPQVSLARQRYTDESEAAINEQINVEYNVSYVYHALFAYFDRDNVALKGLAKFFKESSEEEREHAEKLMEYQNKRGGRVKLHSVIAAPTEFDHAEKGDALYDQNNDPQLMDFIESEYLAEQVEAIKKIADYVSQLRRVGKGHGVWHFDQYLLHEGDAAN
ncbi:hypothetical protein C1H46_036647 [Malus baccata]|uniref:Ferritin n=1 Tax=Malus baccata TaxID=106549 RepID=A0A540KUE7_MALBA|nr:hypothetical protein C1H46_036647 [Malus baccata]